MKTAAYSFRSALFRSKLSKAWKDFDADTGKDSAREIREYFIPDFSNRKTHDAYTAAFCSIRTLAARPEGRETTRAQKRDHILSLSLAHNEVNVGNEPALLDRLAKSNEMCSTV